MLLGLRGKRLLSVYFLDQARGNYLERVRGRENKKYERPYRRLVREDEYQELSRKARAFELVEESSHLWGPHSQFVSLLWRADEALLDAVERDLVVEVK